MNSWTKLWIEPKHIQPCDPRNYYWGRPSRLPGGRRRGEAKSTLSKQRQQSCYNIFHIWHLQPTIQHSLKKIKNYNYFLPVPFTYMVFGGWCPRYLFLILTLLFIRLQIKMQKIKNTFSFPNIQLLYFVQFVRHMTMIVVEVVSSYDDDRGGGCFVIWRWSWWSFCPSLQSGDLLLVLILWVLFFSIWYLPSCILGSHILESSSEFLRSGFIFWFRLLSFYLGTFFMHLSDCLLYFDIGFFGICFLEIGFAFWDQRFASAFCDLVFWFRRLVLLI